METILAILAAHRAAILFATIACVVAYLAPSLIGRALSRHRHRVAQGFYSPDESGLRGYYSLTETMTMFERFAVTEELLVLGSVLGRSTLGRAFEVRITVSTPYWSRDYDFERFRRFASNLVLRGSPNLTVSIALVIPEKPDAEALAGQPDGER